MERNINVQSLDDDTKRREAHHETPSTGLAQVMSVYTLFASISDLVRHVH